MTDPYEPGTSHLDRLWPPSYPLAQTASVRTAWRWLESTRDLQSQHFGVDYDELRGEKLADYMRTQIAAIASELGEFSQEVDWKPWVNGEGERGWVHRDNAVVELVDLAHFIANALCALDVTDDEWEERYRRKQQVNRDRRATGYDSKTTKCECGRAIEDGDPCSLTWGTRDLNGYRCICGNINELP